MTAARPGWHPRARLFATRSPVLLQNSGSRSLDQHGARVATAALAAFQVSRRGQILVVARRGFANPRWRFAPFTAVSHAVNGCKNLRCLFGRVGPKSWIV